MWEHAEFQSSPDLQSASTPEACPLIKHSSISLGLQYHDPCSNTQPALPALISGGVLFRRLLGYLGSTNVPPQPHAVLQQLRPPWICFCSVHTDLSQPATPLVCQSWWRSPSKLQVNHHSAEIGFNKSASSESLHCFWISLYATHLRLQEQKNVLIWDIRFMS